MKRIILFCFGVCISLQACSPEPVYRLKAEADERQTSYYQGVEYIHMQQDSLHLTLSYYEHTSSMFALEVEIVNETNRIVRVAPDSFGYKSYNGVDPENPGKLRTFAQAKNPEQKILNLDLALSQQKANQQTDELLFYTLQGLTLASGIAADSKEEQEEAGEQLAENAVHQQVDRAEYRYNRSSLRGTREFWEAEALRITDLWPGEKIRGLVYFETDPDAKLYKILMINGDFRFSTWFRQNKYKPGGEENRNH